MTMNELSLSAGKPDLAPAAKSNELNEEAVSCLWALMARQTDLYTMGESSSVPVETAGELFEGLQYILDAANCPLPSVCEQTAMKAFFAGQKVLQKRLEQCKRSLFAVCRRRPAVPAVCLGESLRGIAEYLNSYDWRFFPHMPPADIDYPLCQPVPEQLRGIDYAVEYVKRITAEDRILCAFPSAAVRALLSEATPLYMQLPLNLCEQPIINAAGLAMCVGDVKSLNFSELKMKSLLSLLENLTEQQIAQALSDGAKQALHSLGLKAGFETEYAAITAAGAACRVASARDNGSLGQVFVSFGKP